MYSLKQDLQARDAKISLLEDEVAIYRQEVAQLRNALRYAVGYVFLYLGFTGCFVFFLHLNGEGVFLVVYADRASLRLHK